MQRKCVFPCSDFKARLHSDCLLPLNRARSSCVAAKEPPESPSPSSTHSSPGSIRDASHLFSKMTCSSSVPLSPINYSVTIKPPEQEQRSEVRLAQNCMQSFTASQFGTDSHQGQTERKVISSKPRSHQDTKPTSSQCLPTRACSLCSLPRARPLGSNAVPLSELSVCKRLQPQTFPPCGNKQMRREKKKTKNAQPSRTLKMHPGCKDRIDPHELDLEQGRSGEQGSRLLQGSRKNPLQEGKARNSPKVRTAPGGSSEAGR